MSSANSARVSTSKKSSHTNKLSKKQKTSSKMNSQKGFIQVMCGPQILIMLLNHRPRNKLLMVLIMKCLRMSELNMW